MSVCVSVASRSSMKQCKQCHAIAYKDSGFLNPKVLVKLQWSYGAPTCAVGKPCDFRQITRYVWALENGTRWMHNFYESRMPSIEWWHCRWPWVTLTTPNHPYFAFWVILHIFGMTEASVFKHCRSYQPLVLGWQTTRIPKIPKTQSRVIRGGHWVTQGHRQCHHSIEGIQLPVRLS